MIGSVVVGIAIVLASSVAVTDTHTYTRSHIHT